MAAGRQVAADEAEDSAAVVSAAVGADLAVAALRETGDACK